MSYARFGAMILVSTVTMFVLTYVNTFQFDHIYFSQTRMWMALMMGSVMAVIMLSFMLSMYKKTAINIGIYVFCAVLAVTSIWLVRSQATVDDVSYMEAMIPHHSIAILTSTEANISDPRVRELADGIIEAQVREIGEMKSLITDLRNGGPTGQ